MHFDDILILAFDHLCLKYSLFPAGRISLLLYSRTVGNIGFFERSSDFMLQFWSNFKLYFHPTLYIFSMYPIIY
jgi:hypothetical protein